MEEKLRELQKLIIEWARKNSEISMNEIHVDHDYFSVKVHQPHKIIGLAEDEYKFDNKPLYRELDNNG